MTSKEIMDILPEPYKTELNNRWDIGEEDFSSITIVLYEKCRGNYGDVLWPLVKLIHNHENIFQCNNKLL